MADLGDLIPLTVVVRDPSGALVNANTIALTITLPDNTTVTPVITNPPAVTGTYTYDYQTMVKGRFRYTWTSTNPISAYSDVFDVRDVSAHSIFSLADAKKHLNMTSTVDDEEVRQMVEAVTSVIESYRNEAIPRQTVVEQHVMGYGNQLALSKCPVVSITSILDYQDRPQDITKWHLDGTCGILTNYQFRWFNGRDMTVTYEAGYTEIPANYILAAKIILAHLWTTQRIQNIGQQVTLGTRARPEEAIITPAGLGFAIPMRAVELLGSRASVIV